MSAVGEGQGGLIVLSVKECDRLLRWYSAHLETTAWDDPDLLIYERLVEWRSRHTPETAT